LLALYNTVHHFGGILVTPGYADPSPVLPRIRRPGPRMHCGNGTIAISEDTTAATRDAGQRVASVTADQLAGRSAR
jgi:NAD(P)H dehydrogenase (quinone)